MSLAAEAETVRDIGSFILLEAVARSERREGQMVEGKSGGPIVEERKTYYQSLIIENKTGNNECLRLRKDSLAIVIVID